MNGEKTVGVEVPRAPRAREVPDAQRRMEELQGALRSQRRGLLERAEPCVVPVACVLAGSGLILVALALAIELMPGSFLAQFAVMLSGGLP